jgi:Lar family restriction alleviation protein
MSDKLKPCPFCGSEAKIIFPDIPDNKRDVEFKQIICSSKLCPVICKSFVDYREEHLIESWNTRK